MLLQHWADPLLIGETARYPVLLFGICLLVTLFGYTL